MKTYKYRAYPTDEQIDMLYKTSGCCRLVWNMFLNLTKEEYDLNKSQFSNFTLRKLEKEYQKKS